MKNLKILRTFFTSLKSAKHSPVNKVVVTEKAEIKSEQIPVVVHIDPKAQLHQGKVRSGQQVYAKENDLVIQGNVNAGAEVIADGNIYIYGVLRGRALAGAMGDQDASVYCTSLATGLVSIAGVYNLRTTTGICSLFISAFSVTTTLLTGECFALFNTAIFSL
jgi:septum site-determining protein MinC